MGTPGDAGDGVQTSRVDLQAPPADRWLQAVVPEDWEPVAQLCAAVRADSGQLTRDIVAAIEREVPIYRDLGAVPKSDLTASVASNLDMILFGIAERRGPTAEELAVRRELGSRRAMQGHPVDALIQAFQVGYREIWQFLVDEARNDPVVSSLLLSAVTTLWQWVYEVSNAVAETHLSTTRSREFVVTGLRQRFLELLVSGELESDELSDLARSLGFDPDDDFRAFCIRADVPLTDEADQVMSALSSRAVLQVIPRARDFVVLTQGNSPTDELDLIASAVPHARIGAGLKRRGLVGARMSIGDAERALVATTSSNRAKSFEHDWFTSMFLVAKDRLQPILEVGVQVAEQHPDFAGAVLALGDCGFSVTEVARRLVVHPNTAMYRINRWQELTGWDPRSFQGLVKSIASITVAMDHGVRREPLS